MKKVVYRPDDQVVIENPQIVVRVGYPLGIREGVAHIMKNHEKDVRELFTKVIGHPGIDTDTIRWSPETNSREFDEVIRRLAYAWIKEWGFGGAERSIHTVSVEALKGRKCRVISRKTACTGTRSPGYGGYGPEDDAQPPYLEYVKGHVLLELDVPFYFDRNLPYVDLQEIVGRPDCWIEACNVRKLYDSKSNKWLEEEEVPWNSSERYLDTNPVIR